MEEKGGLNPGIWRKVRHPNYTGEMMVWIGIYLICVGNLDSRCRMDWSDKSAIHYFNA